MHFVKTNKKLLIPFIQKSSIPWKWLKLHAWDDKFQHEGMSPHLQTVEEGICHKLFYHILHFAKILFWFSVNTYWNTLWCNMAEKALSPLICFETEFFQLLLPPVLFVTLDRINFIKLHRKKNMERILLWISYATLKKNECSSKMFISPFQNIFWGFPQ